MPQMYEMIQIDHFNPFETISRKKTLVTTKPKTFLDIILGQSEIIMEIVLKQNIELAISPSSLSFF